MNQLMKFAILLLSLLLLPLTLTVCTSNNAKPIAAETPESPESPVEPNEAVIGIASSDLSVGKNRFVFGILDTDLNPVRSPSAKTAFIFVENEIHHVDEEGEAKFVSWPGGRVGAYVTHVNFNKPGQWVLIVEAQDSAGVFLVGNLGFEVKEQSLSPEIGTYAPRSDNKTVRDLDNLGTITSADKPDPELYSKTITEAVSSGLPTIVTFSTPGFCQTATCGPQLDVVTRLKNRHRGNANFIHVEVFDNPNEMVGNFDVGRVSKIMGEWGLSSEPWTFVLDRFGRVAWKFEAFVTEAELESALKTTFGS